MRKPWVVYFMDIAKDVSSRGTCLRRVYGAVITTPDHKIVSTGYCGAPTGEPNCTDIGTCERQRLNIPSGERYELCRSVHAEMNALIQGDPDKMKGGTIYIWGTLVDSEEPYFPVYSFPCALCLRMIRNAGIAKIVYMDNSRPQHRMTAVIGPTITYVDEHGYTRLTP